MKYKNSPLCSFCNLHDETIEHLFWDCQKSQNLIKKICIDKLNISDICKESVLLGTWNCTASKYKINNLIIIYIKMYLFRCRTNDTNISMNGAMNYINYVLTVDEEKAIQYDYLETFHKEWKSVIDACKTNS